MSGVSFLKKTVLQERKRKASPGHRRTFVSDLRHFLIEQGEKTTTKKKNTVLLCSAASAGRTLQIQEMLSWYLSISMNVILEGFLIMIISKPF